MMQAPMSALPKTFERSVRQSTEPPAVDPLPDGSTVGDYEIVAAIERGDALTGYAAMSLLDGSEVRLMEFLPPRLCSRDERGDVFPEPDPESRARYLSGLRRFLNQGRTLAHLNAPGLAKVFACWAQHGSGYLVAAADGGRRLDRWRASQEAELPEALLWRIADRLLDALDALHRVHCLHLELSPVRVLMTAGREPVLLEAASAWRLLDRRDASARAQYQGHFAAPELNSGDSHGEAIGPWTDVYALAATLYWLATGEPAPRAADRAAGDVRRTLDLRAAGRYGRDLLNAIEDGLSLPQPGRADWVASWRETCRRHAGGAGSIGPLDDLIAPLAAAPSPPAAPSPLAVPAPVRTAPAGGAGLPNGRRLAPTWVAGGMLALLAATIIMAWPVTPAPVRRDFNWEPKPITVESAARMDADAAGLRSAGADRADDAGPGRQVLAKAVFAPMPHVSAGAQIAGGGAGHVTAALDVGPDGTVTTVNVLASQPRGRFDSEVIRTLLRWRYEPTGVVQHVTIDIPVLSAD
jgi:TonB family protein